MADRILGLYTEYRSRMTDNDSREAYNNFIVTANTSGVCKWRIIKALQEMGSAEDVAKIFACFANSSNFTEVKFQKPDVISSLDLIINGQLPIHPKALATLYNSTQPNQTKNDLERIVDLTGSFDPNQRENVNKVLQTHRMCTLEEKRAWTEHIQKVLVATPEYAILFEDMSLAEAFDLKTVFQYTDGTIHVGLRLAEMMGCTDNIEKIINCIEIINVAVKDACEELERDWKQAEDKEFSSTQEKKAEFSRLKNYYLINWATPSKNPVGMKTRLSAWKKNVAHTRIERKLDAFRQNLNDEMKTIDNLWQSMIHKWEHPLTATCHFLKHHELTVKLKIKLATAENIDAVSIASNADKKALMRDSEVAEEFYGPTCEAPRKREIYLNDVPKSLFTSGNKKRTAPYQTGLRGYSTYLQDKHYFGVKSHTLDDHNLDSSIVLTHYVPDKKILDAYSSEIKKF